MNIGSWCSCCSINYNHSATISGGYSELMLTTSHDYRLFSNSTSNQIGNTSDVFPSQNQTNYSQQLHTHHNSHYNAYNQTPSSLYIDPNWWPNSIKSECCFSPTQYYENHTSYRIPYPENGRPPVLSEHIPFIPNHSYSQSLTHQVTLFSYKQVNNYSNGDEYSLSLNNIKLETNEESFVKGANTPSYNRPGRRRNFRKAGIMQLQCSICSKTFSRPYNLKSHIKIHTKERPYICHHGDCKWTFARPHDLKRHELLHLGIKPFSCVCGKRFSRSDAYKRHLKSNSDCSAIVAFMSTSDSLY